MSESRLPCYEKRFQTKNIGEKIMAIYRCKRCNYLYIDDENEIPFDRLMDEYKCPKCKASRQFFVKKSIGFN